MTETDSQDGTSRAGVTSATRTGDHPRSARRPLLLLLAIGLAVGLTLGNDFGVSWDEVRNVTVGEDALGLLSGSRDYFSNPSLADHGPAYFIVFSAASRGINHLLPAWTEADGRHLVNFLTFLVAVVSFYFLSRRLVRSPFDWMATALFATQPLFFGYAFVGQKDIPFLAAFMATLVLGLAGLDKWMGVERPAEPSSGGGGQTSAAVIAEWRALGPGRKLLLILLAVAAAGLALDLALFGRLHHFGESLVAAAYNGAAPPPVQALFDRLAVDAYKTPLDAYLAKYEAFYANAGMVSALLLAVASLCAVSLALPSAGDLWGFSRKLARSPAWLASAILLGITICLRQVGAFVGLLVSVAALVRGRQRALFPLVVYWLTAAASTLVTWPYLWPDPIQRFIGSLRLAAVFERHSTLFRGERVASGGLPWDYFPTLTAFQLTETALFLLAVGLVAAVLRLIRPRRERLMLAILALWVAVPLTLLIAFKTAGYEFRQLLFVLPPLLLVAGIGLEAIGERVRPVWGRTVLFVLVLLPGIVGIARLHPYEYIYFNAFAGGVSGANGQFQLDRECLSYREAISVVNALAQREAVVVVPQQTNQVEPFARPDLVLRDLTLGLADADFVLSCIWRDENDWPTQGFARVAAIRRGTAVLTEVWQRVEQP